MAQRAYQEQYFLCRFWEIERVGVEDMGDRVGERVWEKSC